MNIIKKAGLVLMSVVIMAPLTLTAPADAAEPSSAVKKGDAYVLSGRNLELVLDEGGVIRSMKAYGETFQSARDSICMTLLYDISCTDKWNATNFFETTPQTVRVSIEGGSKLKIVATDFYSAAYRQAWSFPEVTSVVSIDGDDFVFEDTVTLRDPGNGHSVVVAVEHPRLTGIKEYADSVFYMPMREGQRFENPYTKMGGNLVEAVYPVPMSAQYNVMQSGAITWSIRCEDKTMAYKKFRFGGKNAQASLEQFPYCGRGQSVRLSTVRIRANKAGWHDTADVYRAWFQTWAKTARRSPALDSRYVIDAATLRWRPHEIEQNRSRTYTFEEGKTLVRNSKKTGYGASMLLGWHGDGHDTDYPEQIISPAIGGEKKLKELTLQNKANGFDTGFYTNARLGRHTSPVARANMQWCVYTVPVDKNTQTSGGLGTNTEWYCNAPQIHEEPPEEDKFWTMNPMSGWQDYYKNRVLDLFKNYDATFCQLDQIGAATSFLCYTPDGKAPAAPYAYGSPATAWAEGYARLLTSLDAEASKINPNAWFWCEGAWEGALQYIQCGFGNGFDSADWAFYPGSVSFPRVYRYTFPTHHLFTSGMYDGIPCKVGASWQSPAYQPTVLQTKNAGFFQTSTFKDSVGLSVDKGFEAVWHQGKNELMIYVKKPDDMSTGSASFTLSSPFLKGRAVKEAYWVLDDGKAQGIAVKDGSVSARVEFNSSRKSLINGLYIRLDSSAIPYQSRAADVPSPAPGSSVPPGAASTPGGSALGTGSDGQTMPSPDGSAPEAASGSGAGGLPAGSGARSDTTGTVLTAALIAALAALLGVGGFIARSEIRRRKAAAPPDDKQE